MEREGAGFKRTTLTDDSGNYRIEDLSPAAYSVSVQRPGFRTVVSPHVTIEIHQQASLDFQLKVGEAHESVEVAAQAPAVQTEDSTLGYRIDSALATQLPLDERNVIALVTLGPGAVPRQLSGFTHDVDNDVQQGSRGSVALNPPINGARPSMNSYLTDGADNTDRNAFAIVVTPPLESVQEFRIQSSLTPPAFAQSGGGVVDLVTKAGTREFHGNAFEYFSNEATDARNYFDDPTLPRPIFRRNQYGASLGGPLPLPSTYFFAAYEGLRSKSATPSLQLVPDATMRSGDFSAGNAIFDPLSSARCRKPHPVREQHDSRHAHRFHRAELSDPVRAIAEPPGQPLQQLHGRYAELQSQRLRILRIDHQFHNAGVLFGRYVINDDRGGLGGAFPLRPTSEKLRAQQAALGYTIGGVRWTNETRLAFNRLRLFDVPLADTNIAASLGIPGAPTTRFTFGLPYFFLTDFSTVTDDPTLPQIQRDNTWSFSDTLSLTRGRRTYSVGVSGTYFQLNYRRSNNVRGMYTYTGGYTGNGTDPATGDALADFLLGLPQTTNAA